MTHSATASSATQGKSKSYDPEDLVQSVIRQISELVVTVALLAFAWSMNGLPAAERSGELIGGIVGSVMIYWINKGTSSATTRGLQEVTARALNGPLHAISDTNLRQTAKVEELQAEIAKLHLAVASIQQQQTYGPPPTPTNTPTPTKSTARD